MQRKGQSIFASESTLQVCHQVVHAGILESAATCWRWMEGDTVYTASKDQNDKSTREKFL